MSLMGILFYVIIFIIIVNAKKQEKENYEKTQGKARRNMERRLEQGKFSGKEDGKPVANTTNKNRQSSPNVSKQKPVIPNVPREKDRKSVTLEPHSEERSQPRMKTNHLWGEDKFANQRIVALRLMEGDPVPQGYIVVKCPYCAAENLVTKNCKQHHSCYFCRVPID